MKTSLFSLPVTKPTSFFQELIGHCLILARFDGHQGRFAVGSVSKNSSVDVAKVAVANNLL